MGVCTPIFHFFRNDLEINHPATVFPPKTNVLLHGFSSLPHAFHQALGGPVLTDARCQREARRDYAGSITVVTPRSSHLVTISPFIDDVPKKTFVFMEIPHVLEEVNHLGMMINGYTCGRLHKSDCGMYILISSPLRQPGTTWECHPNTWEDDMGKMTECTWADPKDTCHTLFLSQQMYIHFFLRNHPAVLTIFAEKTLG